MSALLEEPFVGEDGYYHYLYRVTNTKNGMVYIGIHSTDDLDDDYMGSGTFLREEQEKYGIENFKKEILEFFDSREELSYREWEIVDEEFIQRSDTYNLVLGGDSGLYEYNKTEVRVLDLEGNEVQRFSSGKEAEKHFGQTLKHHLNKNRVFRDQFYLVSDSKVSESARKKLAAASSVPVRLLDLEGNEVRVFSSRKEAEKHFGQDLGRYLNKDVVFRDQFYLVSDSKVSKSTKKKLAAVKSVPVLVLDLEGNEVQRFSSRKEAEKHFGQQLGYYLNKDVVFRDQFYLVSDSKWSETARRKVAAASSVPVRVLDLEGNEVQRFSSREEAEEHFGQYVGHYLNKNNVFRDRFLLVSESKWSESTRKKLAAAKSVPVRVLDLEGNEVQRFSSKKGAEEHFGQDLGHYINKNKVFKDQFLLVSDNKESESTRKKRSTASSVPVRVLDLEGNEVQNFFSRKEAEEHFGQTLRNYLNKNRVFRERFLLVSDSKWSETSRRKLAAANSVPVRVLDLEGNEVQMFSSRKEAAQHFGQRLDHYLNKPKIFKKKYYLVTEKTF